MKYFFFLVMMITGSASFAQNKDEQAIRKILGEQTMEWNNGNLEKFMSGYWQNDSLVFIGKKGPVYGFNSALNNYKKSYPDTSAMGKLHFEIVSVTRLSNEYYFVIGKWFLNRSVGNVNGAYTLLFRKMKGKWKIIVDHSS
jgi:hypothetical protein